MEQLIAFFLPFILMLTIFYVFIIRPQNKEKKRLNSLIENLQKNDKIITYSGIVGKVEIINKDENTIILNTEGSKIKIIKEAVKDKQ